MGFTVEPPADAVRRARFGMRMDRYAFKLICALVAVGIWSEVAGESGAATGPGTATFPRRVGMNIGAKNYEDANYQKDLSRLDVGILGFYRGWQPSRHAPIAPLAIRNPSQALKTQDPTTRLARY